MIDIRVNDDMMDSFISDMNIIKDNMEIITEEVVRFQMAIYESEHWKGNGHEECAAFLSLIAKYCGLIAGMDVSVADSGTTSMSLKEVTGSAGHFDAFLKNMSDYCNDIKTFEKNAADKAACICILDELQGD